MDYLIGYLILGVIVAEFLFWFQRNIEGEPVARTDKPVIYFMAVIVGLPVILYYLVVEIIRGNVKYG